MEDLHRPVIRASPNSAIQTLHAMPGAQTKMADCGLTISHLRRKKR